ncbi:hypothetical protein J6590_103220, partial [Homalodisca vitripennis]
DLGNSIVFKARLSSETVRNIESSRDGKSDARETEKARRIVFLGSPELLYSGWLRPGPEASLCRKLMVPISHQVQNSTLVAIRASTVSVFNLFL